MDSLSKPSFKRRLTIAVVTAAAFAAAPGVAQALPAPDEGARSYEAPAPSNARLEQVDRLGPK